MVVDVEDVLDIIFAVGAEDLKDFCCKAACNYREEKRNAISANRKPLYIEKRGIRVEDVSCLPPLVY